MGWLQSKKILVIYFRWDEVVRRPRHVVLSIWVYVVLLIFIFPFWYSKLIFFVLPGVTEDMDWLQSKKILVIYFRWDEVVRRPRHVVLSIWVYVVLLIFIFPFWYSKLIFVVLPGVTKSREVLYPIEPDLLSAVFQRLLNLFSAGEIRELLRPPLVALNCWNTA